MGCAAACFPDKRKDEKASWKGYKFDNLFSQYIVRKTKTSGITAALLPQPELWRALEEAPHLQQINKISPPGLGTCSFTSTLSCLIIFGFQPFVCNLRPFWKIVVLPCRASLASLPWQISSIVALLRTDWPLPAANCRPRFATDLDHS